MKFCRLVLSLLSFTACLLAGSAGFAAPPEGTALPGRYGVVRVLTRHSSQGDAPYLLMGPLSATSPGTPPALVAARFLAEMRQSAAPAGLPTLAELSSRPGRSGRSGAELVPPELANLANPEVTPVGHGHVVRLRQSHHGIPVRGGEVLLRIDEHGQVVRLLSSAAPPARLAAIDLTPRVTAAQAEQAVRARRGNPVGSPVLEIDPSLGQPLGQSLGQETGRLVWTVASAEPTLLENAEYLVDAASGAVLRRLDHLWTFDQFSVYQANIIENDSVATMALPGGSPSPFSPGSATPRLLTSPLLEALNCVDDHSLRTIQGQSVHACVPQQLAAANASNDYTAYTPLVNATDGHCPTVGDANLNQFAEQHMYYHAANIYNRFRTLFANMGTPDYLLDLSTSQAGQPGVPLQLVVNLCTPSATTPGNVNTPLSPLLNALYFPPTASGYWFNLAGQTNQFVGFGMGPVANFALDGDVVYHEFTHAVVNTQQRLLTKIFSDSLGMNDDGGAINEALADFFSCGLSGDPAVGEYAAKNFGFPLGQGVRNLDNTDQCADQRVGEIHADSTPFSGALWQARLGIAGDPKDPSAAAVTLRDAFDQTVLSALQGTSPYPTMTEMANLLLQEVTMSESVLGVSAPAIVQAAFTAHGILPLCNRVIQKVVTKPSLCLDGVDSQLGFRRVPGYVGWEITVPATADTLTVSLTTSQSGICLALGDSNIPPVSLELAVLQGAEPITWNMDMGNYDNLVALTNTSGSNWTGQVAVQPGVYNVMLVNGGGSTVGENISFSLSCQNTAGCKAPVPDMAVSTQQPDASLTMSSPPPAGAGHSGCSAVVVDRGGARPTAPGPLAGLCGLLGLLGRGRLRRAPCAHRQQRKPTSSPA